MTHLGLQESKSHAEAGAWALAEGLEGVPGGNSIQTNERSYQEGGFINENINFNLKNKIGKA